MAKKRIITINASPKKDGSVAQHLITFENEVKKCGGSIDRIDLYDYDFPPHSGNLKRKPLRYPFITRIRLSSAMFIATPTYWFNVPGILKSFIDMLTDYIDWENDDVLLEGKKFGCLAVAPGGGATNILENLALTFNTMGMIIPAYGLMFFQSSDMPENPNGWGQRHITYLAKNLTKGKINKPYR